MSGALVTAWMLVAWGSQAVAPWRLAPLAHSERRPWTLAALPLLASGALCAFRLLDLNPDAALARGFGTFRGSPVVLTAALLFAALGLALGVAGLAGAKLEPAGWRLLSLFGATFLFVASFAAELLRIGETDPGAPWALLGLTACRFAIACGAGECLAPGRPALAPLAALALPAYVLFLPRAIAAALLAYPVWLPFAMGALLFGAARWLPARLRRPALGAAALLAGVALTLAAELTGRLGVVAIP